MTKEITCPDCGGKGLHYGDTTLTDEPCQKCEGQGTIKIEFTQRHVLVENNEPPIGDEKLTREELFRNT